MRCSREELRSLGELINTGQVEQLGKRMLVLWPPTAEWDREDIEFLITILRGNKNIFGNKATQIYRSYEKRLKSFDKNLIWVRAIPLRSAIIEFYEGSETALDWLETLRPQLSSPDEGIVDLLVGQIFREKGRLLEARRHLLRAVEHSMQGTIEWYRLEALNAMGLCLAQIGENRLAFEYARTHSIESFKLGHLEEAMMYRAVYGLAMVFGQIDYLVEVKRNLARAANKDGDFTGASEDESNASLRLAMIGAQNEAAGGMYQAAEYAAKSPDPGNRFFSLTCSLLGRYLDTTHLNEEELGCLWDKSLALVVLPPYPQLRIFKTMRENLSRHALPDADLLQGWLSLCGRYQPAPNLEFNLSCSLLICNHLSALLARLYAEQGYADLSASLIEGMALGESREGIFLFVRQEWIRQLILQGKAQEALRICQTVLAQDFPIIDERFAFAKLAAQCCLELDFDQQALAYTRLALSDWKRILDGLFAEEHKAGWLKYGENVISTALAVLAKPLSWMPEQERYQEIFELIELGKARLTTDMVSHAGHISGVYLLPEVMKKHTDLFDVLRQEYPDWYVPVSLQIASYGDFFTRVVHDDTGRIEEITKVNLSALQSVVHLPISQEMGLYASAQALQFEAAGQPSDRGLYNDLMQIMTPRGDSV